MAGFRARYCYRDVLPFTVMVALECSNVGLNTLFKAATMKGLNYYVFITYSYTIAALILLPSSLLIHRKSALPPLTLSIIGKLFLLGSIGCSSLMLGYRGIDYSSPTLASAMSNLIPAFTFILAISFRMEKLAWRTSTSQAKIVGTIVSISGALIVILYKGPAIILLSQRSSTPVNSYLTAISSDHHQPHWVIGGLLLGSEYILTPIWYIVQAQILKEYPGELVVVFFYSVFAGLITGFVGFLNVSDPRDWILKPDVSMAAVVYSGLMGSLLSNSLHAWVLQKKGPVYISMFKPLSIAIAAGMGIIFLGDTLHVGSIIGATIISLGFYAVMWGKATEEMAKDFVSTDMESSSNEKTPLLRNYKQGDELQNND